MRSFPNSEMHPGFHLMVQIHTMLFYIAAVHIVCSVVMHKIASARIQIWRKWLSDEDASSTA